MQCGCHARPNGIGHHYLASQSIDYGTVAEDSRG